MDGRILTPDNYYNLIKQKISYTNQVKCLLVISCLNKIIWSLKNRKKINSLKLKLYANRSNLDQT